MAKHRLSRVGIVCFAVVCAVVAPTISGAATAPESWWSVAKAQDRLAFDYRVADPSEVDQMKQNLAVAQAAFGNANNPTAQSLAAANVAEAKTELALAQRGYPVDIALCSGRGVSKVIAYVPRYKQFKCRMSAVGTAGYVRVSGTLRVLGTEKFSVIGLTFSA